MSNFYFFTICSAYFLWFRETKKQNWSKKLCMVVWCPSCPSIYFIQLLILWRKTKSSLWNKKQCIYVCWLKILSFFFFIIRIFNSVNFYYLFFQRSYFTTNTKVCTEMNKSIFLNYLIFIEFVQSYSQMSLELDENMLQLLNLLTSIKLF